MGARHAKGQEGWVSKSAVIEARRAGSEGVEGGEVSCDGARCAGV